MQRSAKKNRWQCLVRKQRRALTVGSKSQKTRMRLREGSGWEIKFGSQVTAIKTNVFMQTEARSRIQGKMYSTEYVKP